MVRLLKSLMLVAALATAPVQAADTAPPSEAALAFVGAFSDDHLSGMLSRVGGRQPQMVALSQLNGTIVAATFDAEIDKAVTKYGPQWRHNMALAWMPLLSTEEFESLTANAAGSPYGEKYLSLRGDAGKTMGALSQELFAKIVDEVIQNTVKSLTDDKAGASTE